MVAKKAGAKKTPAKKAPAAKAEKEPKEEGPSAREVREARYAELTPQIVEARESGEKWNEIAERLGIAEGLAMQLFNNDQVKPKDRIKGDEDEVAAGIVSARNDDQQSWGLIAARAGMPESRVRKIYRDTTGDSDKGNRIGKGGRYPAGVTPPEKPAKAAKKASSKSKETSKWDGMDAQAIADELGGKQVTIKVNGKNKVVKGLEIDDIVGEGPDAEVTAGDLTFVLSTVVRVK